MLKKTIFFISFILIIFSFSVYANNTFYEIIDNELGTLSIGDFDIKDFKNEIIDKGELPDLKGILRKISDILLKETGENIKMLLVLVIPVLLMCVF